MKQKKWSGADLTPEELKEIKREQRSNIGADFLLAFLTLIAGIIIIAVILEILL